MEALVQKNQITVFLDNDKIHSIELFEDHMVIHNCLCENGQLEGNKKFDYKDLLTMHKALTKIFKRKKK